MNMLTISILLTIQLLNKIQSVPINICDAMAFVLLHLPLFIYMLTCNEHSFIPNERIFNRQGADLDIVHFQKARYPRNQLVELFQHRAVPEKLFSEGAP